MPMRLTKRPKLKRARALKVPLRLTRRPNFQPQVFNWVRHQSNSKTANSVLGLQTKTWWAQCQNSLPMQAGQRLFASVMKPMRKPDQRPPKKKRLPRNWKFSASEKTTNRTRKKGCRGHFCNKFTCASWISTKKILLFGSGWRSPIIPTLSRLPIVVLPVRGWRRTCWRTIFPPNSRVNRVVVLLENSKSLSMTLSCLVCWMDWTICFASSFNVFFVKLTIRLLRFTKISSSDLVFLFFYKRRVPVLLPSSPFFSLSFIRMVFQCKCVVLSNLFFCPSMFRQIPAIMCFLIPPFKNSLAMTILCILGFSQHIACFVIHCLTQWLTMPSTAGLVLLHYVSKDRQHVKSLFVEMSTLFRTLHAFSACAVFDTNFTIQSAIQTLSLRRGLVELEDCGIAHLSNQILRFLTEMVDLLRFLKVCQQKIPVWVIFKFFNWSSNCFFAICFHLFNSGMWNAWDFKIYTTTAASLAVLMLFALTIMDFLGSVKGRSFRLCCEFRTSVARSTLATDVPCSIILHNFLHTNRWQCAWMSNCMWSSLIELQSLSLSKLQIAPTHCIAVSFPSMFPRCDSGFVQIVFNFSLILSSIHRVHGCEGHWLPVRKCSRCGSCAL